MSTAALRPPAELFREDQFFAWWVYALLAIAVSLVCFIVGWDGPPHPAGVPARPVAPILIAVVFVPLSLMLVSLLRMTTLVTPLDLHVWFGLVPTYRAAIPLATIQKVEVVDYRPLSDTKGWGIRVGSNGERVFNARGNRGVRLALLDGSTVLVGSQRAEALASAIERARQIIS